MNTPTKHFDTLLSNKGLKTVKYQLLKKYSASTEGQKTIIWQRIADINDEMRFRGMIK